MRPVFKKGSQPGAGTTQPGHQPQASPAPSSTPTPSPVTTTAAGVPIPPTPAQPQGQTVTHTAPAAPTTTTNEPRRMRSTSIYGGLFGNSQPASQPSTGETVSNVGTDTASTPQRNIDQTELEVAWRKASNDLASIDRAINMRMESITPTLKSQTEIELPVGNQDVESFFRNHKNEIFSHLKKYIGEGPLQMSYRIVETGGPQKILSPYEQMLEMTKQNPALNKLRETLGLTVE